MVSVCSHGMEGGSGVLSRGMEDDSVVLSRGMEDDSDVLSRGMEDDSDVARAADRYAPAAHTLNPVLLPMTCVVVNKTGWL